MLASRTDKQARAIYSSMNKETIDCPICEGSQHKTILKDDRYKMGVRTVICQHCGFVFTNPRPTEVDLEKFYQNHYRDFYFDASSPQTSDFERSDVAHEAHTRAQHIYDFIKEYLPKEATLKVFDSGCGEGPFLQIMREKYPEADLFGVEPSPEYAVFASAKARATVETGTLEQFLEKHEELKGKVDLICLSHVLEHMCHPIAELERLYSLLNNDGLLYVEVPNFDSEWHGLGMFHIAHVLQFTPRTLELALAKAGLVPIVKETNRNPVSNMAMCYLCKKAGSDESFEQLETCLSPEIIQKEIEKIRAKAYPPDPRPAWRRLLSFVKWRIIMPIFKD